MPVNWQWVWVTATSTLIAFISYSVQYGVIWPWYGREWSWDLLKLLVPFNLCVAMVWWNYRLCVTTPPGHVPSGWRPDMVHGEGIEVKRGNYAPRYCKMCDHFKPPRAHHCRQCNECILKLDHHCPWIANCVGHYNHGHFIRFLLWVDIATSFHIAMCVARVREYVHEPWKEPGLGELLFIIFNFATAIPVLLCVGMFTIYHVLLVVGNTTTIERWEKDKVATLVRRGKIHEVRFPYSVGWRANMRSVLGPNPLTWLWPQGMRSDGLSFPVNPEAGGESIAEWTGAVAREPGLGPRGGKPRGGGGYQATGAHFPLSGGPEGAGAHGGSDAEAGPSSAVASSALQARLRGHLAPTTFADTPEPEAQYAWPPRDPGGDRRAMRVPEGSAFVYGGEGFNPALKPSNGAYMRAQAARAPRARDGCRPRVAAAMGNPVYTAPWETQLDEDGVAIPTPPDYEHDYERDGDYDSSSSPEHYLSDYDDEDDDDEPLAYTSARVRQGSEGWEVRPAGAGSGGPTAAWNVEADISPDAFAAAHAAAQYPWQRPGRYNTYDPDNE